MDMPTVWQVQKLMDKHSLSHRQADRLYWFTVEGYTLDRALNMVKMISKSPIYS